MPVSKRVAIYALIIIFIANFFSYLDRQIVSALEKELSFAFALSHKQFGLLWTAFTVGYMVFAPIIGMTIDKFRRTAVFGVCIFLWSMATIGSGLASNIYQLYAARFCIGIGEAGCLVVGPTLLSDFFSKEVRGKALSFFFLALPFGGTAGYILGAAMTKAYNWQAAFFAAGAPGFLIAVLVFMLPDPPRGGESVDAHGHAAVKVKGFKPYLDVIKNRTLLFIILAQAFAVIILVPLLHFGVGFFESKHGMTKKEATTSLGIIALIAGALGNSLSGFLGDRLAKRVKGAYALMAGIAFLTGLPFLLIGFHASTTGLMLPALTVGAFCYFLCMPAVNTQIANVVSARQRPMAYALAVFILHLLGDTFAPPIFGAVADALNDKETTFMIFSFALVPAGICCLLAARSAKVDEERAAEADHSGVIAA